MGFINPRSHHWGAPSCSNKRWWKWESHHWLINSTDNWNRYTPTLLKHMQEPCWDSQLRNHEKTHGLSNKELHQHEFLLVGGIPTPLKNMKVSWDCYSQYMETTKFMFQSTNQFVFFFALMGPFAVFFSTFFLHPDLMPPRSSNRKPSWREPIHPRTKMMWVKMTSDSALTIPWILQALRDD